MKRSDAIPKTKPATPQVATPQAADAAPNMKDVGSDLFKPNLTVKFGRVTLEVPPPSEESIESNVRASQEAMQRGAKAFFKTGVRIVRKKGVPLYYAAPGEPDVMVRELDGKKTRGRIVGTRFVAEKPKKAKSKG